MAIQLGGSDISGVGPYFGTVLELHFASDLYGGFGECRPNLKHILGWSRGWAGAVLCGCADWGLIELEGKCRYRHVVLQVHLRFPHIYIHRHPLAMLLRANGCHLKHI